MIETLYVLVACEESQAVTKAFLALNEREDFKVKIEAYSCDILPSSGGIGERHFRADVFNIIQNKGGITQGELIGNEYKGSKKIKVPQWDLMIAHPPCTYLAVSGARWFYDPKNRDKPHPKVPNRRQHQNEALGFFIDLYNSDIDYVAIENPVSIVSTKFKKPSDTVQPYYFGDPFTKTTCLWTRGPKPKENPLPKLKRTNIVDKGERVVFKSGKSQPKWYSDALAKAKSTEERRTLRSKTFPGIANAIAEQYTRYVLEEKSKK